MGVLREMRMRKAGTRPRQCMDEHRPLTAAPDQSSQNRSIKTESLYPRDSSQKNRSIISTPSTTKKVSFAEVEDLIDPPGKSVYRKVCCTIQ
uniref:Death-associated protein-like 1 n=1 Tax=Heterorhabditis bacteriophora TaxID=37862 RepID=A0A1I7WZU4_HETBA